METIEVGPFEFHDKIPLKRNYAELGACVVPHAIARRGAFLAQGLAQLQQTTEGNWEECARGFVAPGAWLESDMLTLAEV